MNNQFASKRSIIQTTLILVLAIGLSLTTLCSCGDIKQTKVSDIADNKKTRILNRDSLIKVVFEFAKPFFNIHSIDNIIALKGKPQYISKTEWGENEMHKDSLVTVKYPLVVFNFLQSPYSYSGLQSLHLLDKNVILAGNTKIGKTTRREIIQNFGLPDSDSNDIGRSLTKDGDTTVYGRNRLGVGDTVTFSYHINIDEYAVDFAMTKDTLRRITWDKNMN